MYVLYNMYVLAYVCTLTHTYRLTCTYKLSLLESTCLRTNWTNWLNLALAIAINRGRMYPAVARSDHLLGVTA